MRSKNNYSLWDVVKSGMYIRIKKEQMKIIENDIELFRYNTDAPENKYKFTIREFLNNVFINMADKRKFNEDSFIRTRKKGAKGFNIKPRGDVISLMEAAGLSSKSYSSDCSAYYMQFVDKYFTLSLIDREKIFYKQLIDELEDGIQNKYVFWIKNHKGRHITVLPYAVKDSDEIHKNYLIGFALKKEKEKDFYIYKNHIDIPLRNILFCRKVTKIDPQKQIHFNEQSDIVSYDGMKDDINKRLDADGILYLSGKLENVVVKLSDNGKEILLNRTQFRPNYKVNENDDHIISFMATQLQTFMYFFKFGADAEILEPEAYRKDFLNKYKEAYYKYEKSLT